MSNVSRVCMLLALSCACGCSSITDLGLSQELPVTITSTTTTPPIAPIASITGAGDSVVAVIVAPATCGRTLSASAGLSQQTVAVAVTLTASGVQACEPIFGSTTYRAVAHGVPAGTRDAEAILRTVFNGAASDSVVARSRVMSP